MPLPGPLTRWGRFSPLVWVQTANKETDAELETTQIYSMIREWRTRDLVYKSILLGGGGGIKARF